MDTGAAGITPLAAGGAGGMCVIVCVWHFGLVDRSRGGVNRVGPSWRCACINPHHVSDGITRPQQRRARWRGQNRRGRRRAAGGWAGAVPVQALAGGRQLPLREHLPVSVWSCGVLLCVGVGWDGSTCIDRPEPGTTLRLASTHMTTPFPHQPNQVRARGELPPQRRGPGRTQGRGAGAGRGRQLYLYLRCVLFVFRGSWGCGS